eukprot:1041149-Amphidinium_carterae.3
MITQLPVQLPRTVPEQCSCVALGLSFDFRPKKALGEIELWDRAEAQLREALEVGGPVLQLGSYHTTVDVLECALRLSQRKGCRSWREFHCVTMVCMHVCALEYGSTRLELN